MKRINKFIKELEDETSLDHDKVVSSIICIGCVLGILIMVVCGLLLS